MRRSTSRERHGDRRRRTILAAAADLATAEGLEGLSIARLARAVGLSKGGVVAHFPSKEELQLEVIEAAAEAYDHRVWSRDAEPGLARTEALMAAWIDFIDGIEYRGGCFFAAAAAEFGARPGAVRDAIARHTEGWTRILERELRTALRQGELREGCDPRLLAFQLHSLVQEANQRRTLLGDEGAFDDARALLASLLANARA